MRKSTGTGTTNHAPTFANMNIKISLGNMEETKSKNGFATKTFVETNKIWAEKVNEKYEKTENDVTITTDFCLRYHESYLSPFYVSYKNTNYEITSREVVGNYLYLKCQGVK